MTIREVFTSKDIQDFHGVLDVVYAGDDGFIYPIKSDVEAVFDVNKNKSFSNGAARRWVSFDAAGRRA
ncbi:MAG: GNAT family N-acetyltransferase, partial [Bacteroidetes bacterium]|nr:GNAT family N-acetyltransferase [Bacteroidota bacterium]